MKKYLTKKYGAEFCKRTIEILDECKSKVHETSADRLRTVCDIILPRIAIYKALRESGTEERMALDAIHEYMISEFSKRKSMRKLEHIPGFFWIFKRVFKGMVIGSDKWKSKLVTYNNKEIAIDITKCLWCDTCASFGVPELCATFCDCDDENFGHLDKMAFERHGTLGKGSEKCDFRFFVKEK